MLLVVENAHEIDLSKAEESSTGQLVAITISGKQ